MSKNLARATAAVAAMALSSGSANALKILDIDFAETTGEHDIHVRYDETQNNWTTATSEPTSFVLDWSLEVRSLQPIKPSGSYVMISVLGTEGAQGLYTLEETRDNPGISYPDISWTGTKTFEIPGNELLVANAAVEMCQYLYAQGERPSESHRAYIGQITSRLETQVANYSVAFSKSAVKTVTSEIYAVCDSDPDWTPQEPAIAFDQGELIVQDIEIFLTTFAAATTEPNVATTCKKGRVLVRITTNKAGGVPFKLWKKIGGGPTTDEFITMWAAHDGAGHFEAEHVEWITVDTTTKVQAKAEELVSATGQTAGWKDITLPCTGQGGNGGFVQDGNTGSEPIAPQAKTLAGDFFFFDEGAPECARTGKALISFYSPKADNIHYSLDCKHGSFSGVAPTVPNPGGGFASAALAAFDVEETLDTECTLKTVAPYGPRTHTTKTHLFQCVTPSGISGADALKPETGPGAGAIGDPPPTKTAIPAKPSLPPVLVPKVTCRDGDVRNGKCACRNGFTPVATGPNDFRCQLAAIPMPLPKLVPLPVLPLPQLVPSPKSKPKIACAGGKVSKGKCVCPKGLKPVSAGGSAFRCTRVAQAPAVKTAPKAVIVPKLPDLRKLFGQ